jgi:hypothetical protein
MHTCSPSLCDKKDRNPLNKQVRTPCVYTDKGDRGSISCLHSWFDREKRRLQDNSQVMYPKCCSWANDATQRKRKQSNDIYMGLEAMDSWRKGISKNVECWRNVLGRRRWQERCVVVGLEYVSVTGRVERVLQNIPDVKPLRHRLSCEESPCSFPDQPTHRRQQRARCPHPNRQQRRLRREQ